MAYLQRNVVAPYVNRELYKKAGLVWGDHVAKSLVLWGDDDVTITNLINALHNELFNLEGNKVLRSLKSYEISAEIKELVSSEMYAFVDSEKLFETARSTQPSLIVVRDVQSVFLDKEVYSEGEESYP